MRSFYFIVLSVLCACQPPAPVVAPPQPDYNPPPDRAIRPDMATPDMRIPDMRTLDVRTLDLGPDILPPDMGNPSEPPPTSRVQILNGGSDAWIAWIKSGRLMAAQLLEGENQTLGVPRDLAPAPLIDRLLGARTRSGRPWVILPSGFNRELHAYDVSAESVESIPLNLYPPAQIGLGSNGVTVAGHTTSDPNSPIGWRVIKNNRWDDIRISQTGMPIPAQIIKALGKTVFVFNDGTCRLLTPLEAGFWQCNMRPGDVAAGDSQQITLVGNHGEDIVAWSAMPGFVGRPDQGSEIMESGAHLITFRHHIISDSVFETQNSLWLLAPGLPNKHLQRFPMNEPSANTLGLVRFREDTLLIEWPSGSDGPHAVSVDSNLVLTPPLWNRPELCNLTVVPETCASAIDQDCNGNSRGGVCCAEPRLTNYTLPENEHPRGNWTIGLTDAGDLYFAMLFDDLNRPKRDCRTLSCTMRSLLVTQGADVEHMSWFGEWPNLVEIHHVNRSNQRLVAIADQVPVPPLVPDMARPDMARPDMALLPDQGVAEAGVDLDAGIGAPDTDPVHDMQPDVHPDMAPDMIPDMAPPPPERTTKVVAHFGDQNVTHDAPCPASDTRALDFDPEPNQSVLITCVNEQHRLDLIDGSSQPLPLPTEGPIHWITDWHPNGIDARIAAVGDDYTVVVFSQPAMAELQIPPAIAALAPQDRVIPIQLPPITDAYPARINGNTLQVLLPGLGWRNSPSTTWPRSVVISAYEPIAFTMAAQADPALLPGAVEDLGIYVHNLRVGSSHWGSMLDPSIVTRLNSDSARGFGVADFPTALGEVRTPNLFLGVGGLNVKLQGFDVQCH